MENKEKIRSLAENVWAYIAAFLRWGILGLLVGGLGGFVGALFAKSVAWATAMRGANQWLLYLLPVGGLAIVGVYKLCRVSGVGTNEVFEGVRSNKGVSILLAPAIFLGTTITHLLGGSAGREGAALQIGGSVATFFGKLFRLNEEDCHILTMCGIRHADGGMCLRDRGRQRRPLLHLGAVPVHRVLCVCLCAGAGYGRCPGAFSRRKCPGI